MQQPSSTNRRLILICILIGFPLGIWLMMAQSKGPSDNPSDATPPLTERASPPTASPKPSEIEATGALAPIHQIAENGRLKVGASSLRDGDVLALGLGLADEARGTAPLDVVVVSVSGRRLETIAEPVEGSESGLRLEFDPDWLIPGLYMVEVRTEEKKPLSLHRYVLEIQ